MIVILFHANADIGGCSTVQYPPQKEVRAISTTKGVDEDSLQRVLMKIRYRLLYFLYAYELKSVFICEERRQKNLKGCLEE